MVITLTDAGTKKGESDNSKLYFPVNPSQINYKSAAYFQEYNIINMGAAKLPNGEEITTIGWESFFPGKNLQSLPFVKNGKLKKGSKIKNSNLTPNEIHNKLEAWRTKGTKLKLNITGTPFSFWVYIDSYEASSQDAYGSIYYTIEFSKAVSISVETVKIKAKASTVSGKTSGKTSGTQRNSKTSSQKKYTVKKGDCLWNIAKKFYKDPTKWKKIYNANKSTIEKAAKKHGKKSSSNGHWIYPGTVLKIT